MGLPDANKKEAVSFRIERKIKKDLDALARSTGRSQTFLVEEALRDYIELNNWQIKAIKEGIESADKGELYSTEEILERLEKKSETKDKMDSPGT